MGASKVSECLCGCRELVKRKYVSGHNWRGKKQSDESILKRVKANTGKKRTLKSRLRMSRSHIGKKLSSGSIEKLRKCLTGRKHSKERCFKTGLAIRKYKSGDKLKDKRGYVWVCCDDQITLKRKWVREHWLAVKENFGRFPEPPEETHHVNGDRSCNSIENLILFKDVTAHKRFHKLGDIGVEFGDIIFDGREVLNKKQINWRKEKWVRK
jgi:hypothetical protein